MVQYSEDTIFRNAAKIIDSEKKVKTKIQSELCLTINTQINRTRKA